VSDPLRDRCLEALRRNALLSGVLEEGYRPSEDAVLRERIRAAMIGAARQRRRRRFLLSAVSAAALLAALAIPSRGPLPTPRIVPAPSVKAAPPEAFLVVTTTAAAPLFEVVPTPSSWGFEVVHTAQLVGPLERARDEELLAAGGVLGFAGHPGSPRKLILAAPVPRRFLE
jgi:hypothetical protein